VKGLLPFAALQAVWLAAVPGAARGQVWLGAPALVPYPAGMLWCERERAQLASRRLAP
jgi:hypothetical protein